jgi:hypothetical protein
MMENGTTIGALQVDNSRQSLNRELEGARSLGAGGQLELGNPNIPGRNSV